MPQVDANRNLLFAIMAVQMDFVSRDAIVSAVLAWSGAKEIPLSQHLVDRGELSETRRNLLDQLLDEHIKAHAGDPARSLQALSSTDGVADLLTRVPDDQLQASLGHLRNKGRTQVDSDVPDDFPTKAHDPRDLPTQLPPDAGPSGAWMTPLAPWGNRFRVVRKHAEGGLGVVSVAIDDELDREVAYKEIKSRHADHRTSQARFVMEAEITGKLEHPGIVPIYGLGHDPLGRPYYAMRFIQGDSLAEAINRFHDPDGPYRDPGQRTLQLRELLGRFLDVCDALAYAHSRGVLHRDLKPGNVMLGPFGETLVVDWGLALNLKEIPSDLESTHAPLKTSKADTDSLPSEQGAIVGTLQYMPPEQAEGAIEKLGPRSDVYGLGAILYDLLTGRHPVTGTTHQELIESIREGKLTPPRQIRADIPRPLEAICLKALSLRPDDRYATPRALASDIKSFLADEPITAYREPLPDRLRRWSRRHRVLVSTLAATLIVGVLGLGSTLAVQREKNRQLDEKNSELATKNSELAQAIQEKDHQYLRVQDREQKAIAAVKRFSDTLINEPILNQERFKNLRTKLLKEPETFFRSLHDDLLADNDTRTESLERLAEAAYQLGYLTVQIGDNRDALLAYEECRQIYQRLTDNHPTVTEYQSDLARTYGNIANQQRAIGKTEAAMQSFQTALAIQKKIAIDNPAVTNYQSDLHRTLDNIGLLLRDVGKTEAALQSFQAALAIQKKIAIDNPGVAEYQKSLAHIYHHIANLLHANGKSKDALRAYEAALEIRKKLSNDNPTVTDYRYELAVSHAAIADLLSNTGTSDDAIKWYEISIQTYKQVTIENPAVTTYQQETAIAHNNLGNLLNDIGKFTAALQSHEAALAIRKQLALDNPAVPLYQSQLASSHSNIGIVLRSLGKPEAALQSFNSALQIQKKLTIDNQKVTTYQNMLALYYNNIGILQFASGNPKAALQSYTSALQIQKQLATENPNVFNYRKNLAGTHHNIGNLLNLTGEPEVALRSYLSALEIQKKLAVEEPGVPIYASRSGATLNSAANIESRMGRFQEARQHLIEAVDWQRKALVIDPKHPQYRQFMRNHLSDLIVECKNLKDTSGEVEARRELTAFLASDPAYQALILRLTAILNGKVIPNDNVSVLRTPPSLTLLRKRAKLEAGFTGPSDSAGLNATSGDAE